MQSFLSHPEQPQPQGNQLLPLTLPLSPAQALTPSTGDCCDPYWQPPPRCGATQLTGAHRPLLQPGAPMLRLFLPQQLLPGLLGHRRPAQAWGPACRQARAQRGEDVIGTCPSLNLELSVVFKHDCHGTTFALRTAPSVYLLQ